VYLKTKKITDISQNPAVFVEID